MPKPASVARFHLAHFISSLQHVALPLGSMFALLLCTFLAFSPGRAEATRSRAAAGQPATLVTNVSGEHTNRLAQPEEAAVVTTTFHLRPDTVSSPSSPILTASLQVQVPSSHPGITALREHTLFEAEYEAAVSQFIPVSWRDKLLPASVPDLVIQDGLATLTITDGEAEDLRLSSLRSDLFLDSIQDEFAAGFPYQNANEPAGALYLGKLVTPAWHTWTVQMNFDGYTVRSASPVPVRDDGAGHMTWRFTQSDAPGYLSVRFEPTDPGPVPDGIEFWKDNVVWRFLAERVDYLSYFLFAVQSSLSLILLWYLLKRRNNQPKDPDVQSIELDLRRAAGATLLGFTLLGVLAGLLFRVLTREVQDFELSRGALSLRPYDLAEIALTSCLLVIAATYYIFSWRLAGKVPRTGRVITLVTVGLVVYLAPLVVKAAMPGNKFDFGTRSRNSIFWIDTVPFLNWLQMGLLIVPLLATTFFAFAGLGQLLRTFGSRIVWLSSDQAEKLNKSLLRKRSVIRTVLIVFSILLAADGVLFLLRRSSIWIFFFREDPAFGFYKSTEDVFLYYCVQLLSVLTEFVPYLSLLGILVLLYTLGGTRTGATIFFTRETTWAFVLGALLFATFVASRTISPLYFPISFFAGIFILLMALSTKLHRTAEEISTLNSNQAPPDPNIVKIRQAEFLTRAQLLKDLSRSEDQLHKEATEGKLPRSEYNAKLARLRTERQRLVSGDRPVPPPPVPEPSEPPPTTLELPQWLSALRDALLPQEKAPAPPPPPVTPAPTQLPGGTSPTALALSTGPEQTWWDNARTATKIGLVAAAFPMSFYIYVLLTRQVTRLWEPFGFFDAIYLLLGFMDELTFWVVAAFVLGALFPYLPFRNGALKGMALSGIYLAGYLVQLLLQAWLGHTVDLGWVTRVLELLLFLTAVGITMDILTLKGHTIYWKTIIEFYNMKDVRVAISYASPLLLSALVIGQQILSGSAQEALTQFLKALPGAIPNLP